MNRYIDKAVESVTVELEIKYEDGSKKLVRTEPLAPARKEAMFGDERFQYGADSSTYMFEVNLRLPLHDRFSAHQTLYHETHIDAPMKYVFMVFMPDAAAPEFSALPSEEEVQRVADMDRHAIYFMLELPE